ncbi:AraC family transcriptional regulator [Paenibacillus glycanilyticus]|uniref:HTH-type transcriptional regulator YbfI n=1 Tax=Paenibacillus glycanilyticus TaxID=126569 RepID=A0ABQ6G7R9_9BACL|nr:AraC family transcriptional regulator [Paenibacillus glycanilyticus]GLX67019.1 putative HTH-type transcriptional regulator YbfI [Paenibacillus glycanilyticus]
MSEEIIFLQPVEAAQVVEGVYFPPYISLAHVFNAPKGWTIGPRRFRQYQFQYVLAGAASYRIEDQSYETKKGDLIVHFPNEEHEVRTLEGVPYVCVSIVFHFGSTSFPLEELLSGLHYVGSYEGTSLESALTAIPAEYHQPERVHRLRAQSLLMEVIYTLLRDQRSVALSSDIASLQESHIKHKAHANLVLLKNYIKERFAETIKYEQLEQLTGWSKNYILLRFKDAYDTTPMQFQIQLRIERAKELAIQSNMSVTEIAHHVGYADVHTFGKIFKKKTGHSLSEFCASLLY